MSRRSSGCSHPPPRGEGRSRRWPLSDSHRPGCVAAASGENDVAGRVRAWRRVSGPEHWPLSRIRRCSFREYTTGGTRLARPLPRRVSALTKWRSPGDWPDFVGCRIALSSSRSLTGGGFSTIRSRPPPAATCAALAAVDGPVWLLAGGEAKDAEFRGLAGAIVTRAQGAAFFAHAARSCTRRWRTARWDFHFLRRRSWPRRSRGVGSGRGLGDAILLSPACASFDQFRDFQERGERFRGLVAELARTAGCLSVKI